MYYFNLNQKICTGNLFIAVFYALSLFLLIDLLNYSFLLAQNIFILSL